MSSTKGTSRQVFRMRSSNESRPWRASPVAEDEIGQRTSRPAPPAVVSHLRLQALARRMPLGSGDRPPEDSYLSSSTLRISALHHAPRARGRSSDWTVIGLEDEDQPAVVEHRAGAARRRLAARRRGAGPGRARPGSPGPRRPTSGESSGARRRLPATLSMLRQQAANAAARRSLRSGAPAALTRSTRAFESHTMDRTARGIVEPPRSQDHHGSQDIAEGTKENVVPAFGALSTRTRPPSDSTRLRTTSDRRLAPTARRRRIRWKPW